MDRCFCKHMYKATSQRLNVFLFLFFKVSTFVGSA